MTFLQGRINGQFIIEGFVASIMTAVGAAGFVILDHANKRMYTVYITVLDGYCSNPLLLAGVQRRTRVFLLWSGILSIITSFTLLNIFISAKIPNYLKF